MPEHSAGSRMWVVDLSVPGEVDQLAASALEELGGVDILVNNAGIPKRRHVTKLDAATVESVMAINYFSPVRLTLALLPQMLDRDSGLIVNVASVAATLSSPGESAYDASKAALAVFSEAMAIDLWDTGVDVGGRLPRPVRHGAVLFAGQRRASRRYRTRTGVRARRRRDGRPAFGGSRGVRARRGSPTSRRVRSRTSKGSCQEQPHSSESNAQELTTRA